jgi:hypothetical protein
MIARFAVWLLTLLRVERHDIGRDNDIYLTRWVLWGTRYGPGRKVFLHLFHRSDGNVMHDHPFGFWPLILWPGYFEHTPGGGKHWYGPLRLLRRPATWIHRVEILPDRTCWTLLWVGKKVRPWGFHCPGGFRPWRDHALALGATGDGCGPLSVRPQEGGQTA